MGVLEVRTMNQEYNKEWEMPDTFPAEWEQDGQGDNEEEAEDGQEENDPQDAYIMEDGSVHIPDGMEIVHDPVLFVIETLPDDQFIPIAIFFDTDDAVSYVHALREDTSARQAQIELNIVGDFMKFAEVMHSLLRDQPND